MNKKIDNFMNTCENIINNWKYISKKGSEHLTNINQQNIEIQ
jgi:hypothetical protein